jgi:hypothetical protein
MSRKTYKDKMDFKMIEINNKKFVEIDLKCRTTNDDYNCIEAYRKINLMILHEKKISYPITIKKSELIIKGDEYGIGLFNLNSIKTLIETHFEFEDKIKYILTIKVDYFNDEVSPYLSIKNYRIQEFPNLLSDETFDKVFSNDDTNNTIQGSDYLDRPNFIFSHHNLLKKIEVEYYEDMFTAEKIDYLNKHNIDLRLFQDLLKCPIIDWELNIKRKNIGDFNQYIRI